MFGGCVAERLSKARSSVGDNLVNHENDVGHCVEPYVPEPLGDLRGIGSVSNALAEVWGRRAREDVVDESGFSHAWGTREADDAVACTCGQPSKLSYEFFAGLISLKLHAAALRLEPFRPFLPAPEEVGVFDLKQAR